MNNRRFLALVVIALGLAWQPIDGAAADRLPATDGLVLWLDAADDSCVVRDSAGRVSRWSDKSPMGNHAEQAAFEVQPRYRPLAIGGQPALVFNGGQYLNLGQPESLGFQPGKPFSVAVICDVRGSNLGTFLAKGGGVAGRRAFQLYAASGRLGAITHGVMREHTEAPGPKAVVHVFNGSTSDIFSNGKQVLTFASGNAASPVDVLVGARRKETDNTGLFWLLQGEIAEILVYDRALSDLELDALRDYFAEKYSLVSGEVTPAALRQALAGARGPGGVTRLEALAKSVIGAEDTVLSPLRFIAREDAAGALAVAELLAIVAHKNQLTDPLARLAGELLRHDDPFVRGMADWAIAMKVGADNNGQEIVWPRSAPPEWFHAWSRQSPDGLVENDWVRQAASQQIHRDPSRLLGWIETMISRATRMQRRCQEAGASREALQLVADHTSKLRALGRRLEALAAADSRQLSAHRRLWLEARRHMRAIVLANPAIDFDQLLFVKQFAPHTVRNITRSYSWKHKPGGDLCVLENLRSGGPVREILQGKLGPGCVWGLDLWWDADRAVFGYARQPKWPPAVDTAENRIEGENVFELRKQHEPLHVFEVGVDGSGLAQLTDDPYWSDFEPTYTACGDVVFASDRCGRSAECGNDTYDHTNPNLYVYSRRDGTVRRLTDSKDIDRYPHSLDDGRIAYTHWEYQERHFMEVHAVWTVRPDGSMADALFKHHMRAPCGLRDTRSIPGTGKLVSIATGHHTFAFGPVVVIDPNTGLNNASGITILTPGVTPQEGPMAGRPEAEGGVPDQGGLYQTPWALSEDCFLVSYAYARPECTAPAGADSNGFALYLIDAYGNKELIHRDPTLSCTFPVPLRKRPRPPMVPVACGGPQHEAACYVTDVYDGLSGVARGTIKYLRIAQHVPWPFDSQRGQMDYISGVATAKRIDFQSWSPVRVIGTVPVERDGSAHFTAPADTAIYFQALDQNHMEIARMRSMVSFKAGEVRGCRGCHESQAAAPTTFALPLATRRPPDYPDPPPWGANRLLGYEWLVQPILDRHCVRCHGQEAPDGGLDFSAARGPDGLLQSYRTMFGAQPEGSKAARVLVACSDRFSNADVTTPKQFGSHRSPLIQTLLRDPLHQDEVALAPDEWLALVTWVDANAPYHDAFFNKRPAGGGPPRREVTPDLSATVPPAAPPPKRAAASPTLSK